jgi:hypothetical protein
MRAIETPRAFAENFIAVDFHEFKVNFFTADLRG